MKIYKYSPTENAVLVILEENTSENSRKLDFPDKKAVGENWEQISVNFLWKDPKTRKKFHAADFPSNVHSSSLMFNDHVIDSLGPYLSQHGEILPLKCDEQNLFILNVTTVIDALDIERSYIVNREQMNSERPAVIRAAFREDIIGNIEIFRLRQPNNPHTYFTENFIEKVKAHDLTGFGARLEWDSHIHANGFNSRGMPKPAH